MNIFVLDRNPYEAAQMLCDAHVIKMIVESCQLLSTNDRLHGRFADPSGLYKSTHVNHPCRRCLESEYNRAWLLCHLATLLSEYTYRFGKVHKSAELYHRYYYIEVFTPKIQDIFARASSWSKFTLPKCMPDEFKTDYDNIDSVVLSYRRYYKHKQQTMKRFRYTKRIPPKWLAAT
jgi:hypothetical protein